MNYLDRILARSTEAAAVLQPRTPSRFEPDAPADLTFDEGPAPFGPESAIAPPGEATAARHLSAPVRGRVDVSARTDPAAARVPVMSDRPRPQAADVPNLAAPAPDSLAEPVPVRRTVPAAAAASHAPSPDTTPAPAAAPPDVPSGAGSDRPTPGQPGDVRPAWTASENDLRLSTPPLSPEARQPPGPPRTQPPVPPPPVPPPPADAAPPHVVVEIGAIEFRASPPPVRTAPEPRRPAISLGEYIARRGGRRGS